MTASGQLEAGFEVTSVGSGKGIRRVDSNFKTNNNYKHRRSSFRTNLYFGDKKSKYAFKKKDIPVLVGIGGADFIANLLLGVATTKGLVSLAVVLGSLYPIVTALLAFKILHERLHKIQYVGIGFAIAGVAVISLS